MKNEQLKFERYLINEGHTVKSVKGHLSNLIYFENWCSSQALVEKEFLSRNAILEYVKFMQELPVKVSTQNIRLASLGKYYAFLKAENIIKKSPVRGLRIRNEGTKVVHHPLSEQALLELFDEYVAHLDAKPKYIHLPEREATNLRRKLIASLVIFQGLHTGELDKLTINDVNLNDSTIYIPSMARSNSRVIVLNQKQIIPFYEYFREKVASDREKLFENKVQKGFYVILEELKGINAVVQNLQHIRASVLMNWIKEHGTRKAQYMIGHRYVSTTQSYEIQDTSELSELMERTHLFG